MGLFWPPAHDSCACEIHHFLDCTLTFSTGTGLSGFTFSRCGESTVSATIGIHLSANNLSRFKSFHPVQLKKEQVSPITSLRIMCQHQVIHI
jgi:hypothetical protein